jgi:23S rRNA pseudouridine2605 synthase
MRLGKYLAHSGVASRRASEELVFSGRVTVAGEVVRDPALDVDGSEGIEVDGRPAKAWKGERAVYLVNKPAGVVSTASDPQGRPTIVALVPSGRRLYPVGRLDADTTGVILLTDDGPLAHRLTHPSFEVPRVYRATVRRPPVRNQALQRLREGVELEDGVTAPARVRRLAPDTVEITIHEGRKRQVRRMLDAVGHPVAALERVAFGPLGLRGLGPGEHRRLTAAEIERLRKSGGRREPERGAAPPPRREPPRGAARRPRGRPSSRRAD